MRTAIALCCLAAWLNVGGDELHFGPSTSQNTFVVAQAQQDLEGLVRLRPEGQDALAVEFETIVLQGVVDAHHPAHRRAALRPV